MRLIRSIIVFNSATAGDFLTSLCWSQLNLPNQPWSQQSSGRMSVDNDYFKEQTTAMFYNAGSTATLDPNKIYPVENSHYWLPCYQELADRTVFIDYPEQVQSQIIEIYLHKVFDNDRQKMLQRNLVHQLPALASKITVDNIDQVLRIHWQKNIKGWRNNASMNAIQLADFFDKKRIQQHVCHLIDNSLTNQTLFEELYSNWLARNHWLRSLF